MNAGLPRFLLGAALAFGLAACGDDGGLPDARSGPDAAIPGQISLAWTVSHDGAPLTCASVSATQVTAEIVRSGDAFGFVDSFSCASGMGTSSDLVPGRFTVRVSLNGGGVLDGPATFVGVEVRAGAVTPLDPIAFDVDPTGSLVFRITTPPTGGNCAPAAQLGAGITTTTLELRDSAGTCVPTTFQIAAGATGAAATYASDCAGASTACIHADQDVRADGISAGQHSMVLVGAVDTAPCWKRTSAFVVRAAGQVTTLNPQALVLDPVVPGCPMM